MTGHESCHDGVGHHWPQTISSEGGSMVDVEGNIVDQFIQRRNFFSRKYLLQHRLSLGKRIELSHEDKDDSGTGVEEPLHKVHVLREASDGAGHEGGVDCVPHGPVDVREAIGSSHEQDQRGILLVRKVVGGFIAKDGKGDNHINVFILENCLNFCYLVC